MVPVRMMPHVFGTLILIFVTGYYGEQPPNSSSGFWTIEYYQKYFDVDTKMVRLWTLCPPPSTWSYYKVLTRCYTTLLPTSSSYLTTHLTPSVDLYGPFWILTTLIFSLFVFSSLASSIASYLSSTPISYDFQLLSIAVTLVYTYGLGIPIMLWVVLRYLGVGEWSPAEAVAVFGYGQFVWIPVSVCSLAWVSSHLFITRYLSDSLCHPGANTAVDSCGTGLSVVWLLHGSKHIPDSRFSLSCS